MGTRLHSAKKVLLKYWNMEKGLGKTKWVRLSIKILNNMGHTESSRFLLKGPSFKVPPIMWLYFCSLANKPSICRPFLSSPFLLKNTYNKQTKNAISSNVARLFIQKTYIGSHSRKGFVLGSRTLRGRTWCPKGPLHTRAKSRDHDIVRAQKKVSKGRPNTPPKSCSVVTDPQV